MVGAVAAEGFVSVVMLLVSRRPGFVPSLTIRFAEGGARCVSDPDVAGAALKPRCPILAKRLLSLPVFFRSPTCGPV